MPRRRDEVERALMRKGFEKKEGDHHFFLYRDLGGKKTNVFTKTSHTPKLRELPDRLLGLMAKQCRLTKSDFFDLLDCPLSREEYDERLQNREQR